MAAQLSITVDVDGAAGLPGGGAGYEHRLSCWSERTYGLTAGLPRILDVLDEFDVRATFYVPASPPSGTRTRSPRSPARGTRSAITATRIASRTRSTRATQRAGDRRGHAALEAVTGRTPRGYRAPGWELTRVTLDALGERGLRVRLEPDGRRPPVPRRGRRPDARRAAGPLGARRRPALRAHDRPGRACWRCGWRSCASPRARAGTHDHAAIPRSSGARIASTCCAGCSTPRPADSIRAGHARRDRGRRDRRRDMTRAALCALRPGGARARSTSGCSRSPDRGWRRRSASPATRTRGCSARRRSPTARPSCPRPR